MRLTPIECAVIKQAAKDCFNDDVVVRLFGSRAFDEQRGGDIDLLITTTLIDTAAIAKSHIQFLSQIYQALGEQKIDILIDYPNMTYRPLIYTIAEQQGVML
jgi:predicted nucleotidyltransferase